MHTFDQVLREATTILSRAELEYAWGLGEVVNQELGHASPALRAEVAAYLIAIALDKFATTSQQPNDFRDVTSIGEGLLVHLLARVRVIVVEAGSQQGQSRIS